MATQIQIKRGSTTPAGLTVGESAMNTSTNQIYLGGTGGTVLVGGEVTGGVDMGAGSAVSANRIPTQSGVYNYVRNSTVTSFNGATGAVTGVASIGGFTGTVTVTDGTYITVRKSANDITFTNTGVQTFNGSTGAVQGVSAAVGSTYLTVSGSTGSVTFTNTGVQTFNGLTGAVTGVTVGGANTFTALNTFNAGLSGHINISETNVSGSMYLLMARGAGVTAVFADTTTTPLVYQPSAGNLGLRGISLAYGNDRLYITPTQITATNTVTPTASYFYFIAQGGNYFQSQNLSAIGDIGAVNSALSLNIDPSTRVMTWGDGYDLTGVTSGFFGVNRSYAGMCADYAVEINSPTGKGLQLIYNDFTGAASNWVNMDVSSGGNYTLRPSGGLATVTGTLNVSAGISAAGGVTLAGTLQGTTANFTGLVSSAGGFSGAGTNLTNVAKLNTSNTFTSGSYLTVNGVGMFAGRVQVTGNSIIFTEGYDDGSTTLLGSPYTGLANTVTLPQTTGTVALTNSTVASFNGLTGAVQGVSAAVGSTYLTVSGSTGSVTFTNTGVQTFNGLTGAVTGVTVGGANTFTALQSFNAGISASALTVAGGATFSSAIVLPINTAPALTIGTSGTKNLILSCVDGAGLIEVGGNTATSLGIRQASGGPVTIGNAASQTFVTVNESNEYIQIQNTAAIDIGDVDGAGNSTYLSISDSDTTIAANCGSFDVYGRLDMNGGYSEAGATATQATNTITFNAASGNTQKFVPSAVVNTVNFTNIATTSTQCTSATLIFLHGATPYGLTTGTFSVQLAGVTKTVKWSGGSAPTLTNTANKTDILNFLTYDGGTTWLGFVGGLNF